MSRFKNLLDYLGFAEAIRTYWLLKTKKLNAIRLGRLTHPFAMRESPSDYATFEEVILKKSYEIPFAFSPNTIIDAGANIGLSAIFFASKYPNAQIISLEPDKSNFAVLKSNASKYPNITALNKGIWSHDSLLKVVDTGRGENSFIVTEAEATDDDGVEAVSIHGLKNEFGWPLIDLLKIDIEGTEKNIFEKNYEHWLPFTKVLFVETHDSLKKGCSTAVLKAIAKYNFSCAIAGENFLFVNESLFLNES